MQVAIVIALGLMVMIGLTTWLVWHLARGQSGVIQNRLETYAARGRTLNQERRPRRTMAAQLDQALRRRSYGQHLADELAKADLQLRVSEFFVLSILSTVVGVLIGLILFVVPVLALLVGVVGFFLPRFYLRRRQSARVKAFNEQLGDSLRLLVSSLRSGYSMLQSMEVLASELPEPTSTEYARVVREVTLGLSQEQALNNMLKRVPSDDLDMMVTALNVQREVGGNLGEILDTISGTIAERVRIQGEIRALTAQQMMSGYLVSFLPFGITLILYMMNPSYMGQLFQDVCGIAMVATGVLMVVSGFLIIRKIVQIQI